MKHTKADLKQTQSLPLSAKILMAKRRIEEWCDREVNPNIETVFVDTGLEYSETQREGKR